MENDFLKQVTVFKAFCEEKRLHILDLLRNGEKCACVLLDELDLSQSGLSYHMKILVESGIVQSRQAGKWTYYKISPEGCGLAIEMLRKLTRQSQLTTASSCCL